MTDVKRFFLAHAWSILLGYIGVVTAGLAIVHAVLTGTLGLISVIGLLPLPALVLAGSMYSKTTRLERDAREQREELEAVRRELEDYTYVVSHELKEPLRSLRIFSGFLLEDYGDRLDEQGRDYVQRLHRASVRLSSLVDDLLLLSRIGQTGGAVERVDMNELVAEARDELAALVEESEATVRAQPLPVVACQRRLMGEVFKNVIANGIRFNEEEHPVVEVSCAERNGAFCFSARDNGIGIEPDRLEDVFDLFTQLHPRERYGGNGAGLAICKKIVEAHGGRIWVESLPGEGTVVWFTIPKHMEETGEVL
jgi:light-regulated signal transduction histidine kinase (bacteriophytochrome)